MQEWANLGVMGIWWGGGAGSQSHYFDAKGDGITNPPPINGNTQVAQYPDDDGGYIRLQSSAYYSAGTLPLPAGNPPSPSPTLTGTPPTATNTTAPATGTPARTSTNTRTRTVTRTPVGPAATRTAVSMTSTPANTSVSTNTAIPTYTPIGTWVPPTATNTATRTRTTIVVATATSTQVHSTATPSECPISFVDVSPSDYFYEPVRYLFCRNIIGGYADNTFRPYGNATRAQLSKMAVLAEGWMLSSPPNNTFADVLPGSTFYQYVETAVEHGVMSGYPCGGTGEPCDPQNRPYFRPNNNVTRGQVAKIMVLAQGWPLLNPPNNTFTDVLPASTFYQYVETALQHGLLAGYPCGGSGEPCDPQNRPYFRPNNSAIRAQVAKIIYLAITTP